LTIDELEKANQKSKVYEEKIDLSQLLEFKEGYLSKLRQTTQAGETPIINGYKIIKDTPVLATSTADIFTKSKRVFKVPDTPTREELGHSIANQNEMKKRQIKAKEKEEFKHKLKMSTP